jgi:hypothetical protein
MVFRMRLITLLMFLLASVCDASAQSFFGTAPAKTVVCNNTTAEAVPANCLWITLPLTAKWYNNDTPPANIVRIGDRVFIGDAVNYTALSTGACGTDWFSNWQATTSNGCAPYINFSQVLISSGGDGQHPRSDTALHVMAQSKNQNASQLQTTALIAHVVNNNTTQAVGAWTFYGECHLLINNGGGCIGMEFDTRTMVDVSGNPNPFQQSVIVGFQNACGAGVTPTGFDCGIAHQIINNPSKWRAGLIIANNSIANGFNGVPNAISMPTTYRIQWFSNSTTVLAGVYAGAGGNLNLDGANLVSNGNAGVSCNAGINVGSFRSVNGLVTAC